MTPELSDFVATYTPKQHPKPFFGFFKDVKHTPKTDRRPMYMKVRTLINRGHDFNEIAEILGTTVSKVRRQIQYFKNQKK